MAESWALDGLELNDGSIFQLRDGEIDLSPARQRPEWIGAADSEYQDLVRDPLRENRVLVLPLQVVPTATKDLAFDKVGQIVDKLVKASATRGGISLVWTSHGTTRTATLDVLAGEITEFNLDRHLSFANRPRLTITLTCKPAWRLPPIANVSDDYSTNTIANYTFDTGSSATTAVSGGALVPSGTGQRIFAHTASPYQLYSSQVTAKFTTATTLTNGVWGVMTTRYDSNHWLVARIEAGTNVLRLVKNNAGTGTLASTAFTPVAATSYWVRIRKEGNLVTGEVWTAAPTVTGTPAASTSFTLTAGDATALGAGIAGYSGLYWTVADTAERADDLSIEPNVFRSSNPNVTGVIYGTPGDVNAYSDLIVTDTAAQARRLAEWGLEGPRTLNTATELIIDSDSMTTSGFAGTGSTQSGAYDPGAAGNNVISMSLLGPQAMAGFTGTHSGVFRIKGRFYCNTSDPDSTKIRLVWKDQDNPQTSNSYVRPNVGIGWNRLDLGTITVSGNWSGYIEASSPYYTETLKLDFLELVPASAGYGKARATFAYQAGVTVGRDEFTSSTAAAVLHTATSGRSATTGGNWVTSGAATDFAYADDFSGEQIKRSSNSDGGRRWAVLGSTDYTDIEVRVDVQRSTTPTTSALRYGVFARWTDSSNYLRAEVYRDNADLQYLYLIQRVAGADTTLVGPVEVQPSAIANGVYYRLRLIVFASGRTFFRVSDTAGVTITEIETTSTTLATGGTLATGKPGFFDQNQSSNTIDRYFDNFSVDTPAAEPVVIYSGRTLTISEDDTVRQNSGATASGKPPSYHPAGRFTVPVGNSRVLVAARRSDTDAILDDNISDSTQIQVAPIVPRALAVPR